MTTEQDLTLSEAEIRKITGYKRAGEQLAELQRRGFYRARRSKTTGEVILERVHYDAICRGSAQTSEPRVRPPQPKLKAVPA